MQKNCVDFGMVIIDCELCISEILSLKIDVNVNTHGTFYMRGILHKQYKENKGNLLGSIIGIQCNQEGKQKTIFVGFITRCSLNFQGGITYVDIEAISGTIKFDQYKVNRIFQDVTDTYGDILRKIAGVSRGVIVRKGNNEKLAYPLIQYQETDWQFINRVASKLETIVIPDVTNIFPQLSVGLIVGNEVILEEKEAYCVKIDFQKFYEFSYKDKEIIEFQEYKFISDKNLQLGDRIYFKGRSWIVLQKKVKLNKGILEFKYWIGGEKSRYKCIKNNSICGLTLTGTVLETFGEWIKISLDIDSEKSLEAANLFAYKYLPITGNIMYSMPEIGASVSLYFPDGEEKNGIVINCIQNGLPYDNCDKKTLEVPEGPKICMAERHMMFAINKETSKVKIFDGKGVSFNSKIKVKLEAKKKIQFSGENINIVSTNSLLAVNKNGADYMEIVGHNTYFHSSRFVLSAIRRRTPKQIYSIERYQIIRDLESIAFSVLGGIRSVKVDAMEEKIMAGIPEVAEVQKPFMSGIASISWYRHLER